MHQEERRDARIADGTDVRAAVPQAWQRQRMRQHGVDVIQAELGVVKDREVQKLRALVFQQRVVDRFQWRDPSALRFGTQRGLNARLIVWGLGHAEQPHREKVQACQQRVGQRWNRAAVPGDFLGLLGQKLRLKGRHRHRGDALGKRQVRDGLVAGKAHKRMKRRVQPQQHTDGSRRHLHADVDAQGLRGLGAAQDLLPLLRSHVALHQRQRQRATCGGGQLLQHVELGLKAVRSLRHIEVRDRLHHAMPASAQRRRNALQLGMAGFRRRGGVARFATVVVGAPGRKSRRARIQRLPQERPHLRDVVVVGWLAEQAALAHDIDPQRVVRHLGHKVDGVRELVDRRHVFGKALPVEGQALGQRGAGDVLDAFHQIN